MARQNNCITNQHHRQTRSLPLGLHSIRIAVVAALHTRPASVMAFGAHHRGTCSASHLQNIYNIHIVKKLYCLAEFRVTT